MTTAYPNVTLLKRRGTRIIATIGPACEPPAILEELIRSGVNVFRLNFSHSDHSRHRIACNPSHQQPKGSVMMAAFWNAGCRFDAVFLPVGCGLNAG